MELWPEWKLAYHPWTLFRINLEFRNYSWYYFPGRIIVLILYKSLTYFVNKIVERTSKGIFNNHNIHTSFICWRIPKAKKFSQKFACITRLPVSASYEKKKKKEKHQAKAEINWLFPSVTWGAYTSNFPQKRSSLKSTKFPFRRGYLRCILLFKSYPILNWKGKGEAGSKNIRSALLYSRLPSAW